MGSPASTPLTGQPGLYEKTSRKFGVRLEQFTGLLDRQHTRVVGQNQSAATSSTSLPKFSPAKSLLSASGKVSIPFTVSSLLFMRPSFR